MKKTNGKLSGLLGMISENPPKKFERFTDLSIAPETEPWLSIKEYYESEKITERIIGIILNGVLTNRKPEFLISFRIINEYISAHQGKLGQPISGATYRKVLAQLNDPAYNFMVCIEKPSSGQSNNNRAGTYRITFKPALDWLDA